MSCLLLPHMGKLSLRELGPHSSVRNRGQLPGLVAFVVQPDVLAPAHWGDWFAPEATLQAFLERLSYALFRLGKYVGNVC